MASPKMYGDLAHLWPSVSPPAQYADEARHWRAALSDHFGPPTARRRTLLELGVGGGNNLSHVLRGPETPHGATDYDAAAVDLSPGMLEHSRRLNPTVAHHVGDMRTVRLGRRFDAVLIHDAISYLTTEADLAATFATAAAHLEPGGILVCAPDWYRESFDGPTASVHGPHPLPSDADGEAGDLSFFEYVHRPDPSGATLEVVYVFCVRRGGRVELVEDRHVTGLFPLATWLAAIEGAGLHPGRRPYPVHADGHEAWLLTARADGPQPNGTGGPPRPTGPQRRAKVRSVSRTGTRRAN